MTDSTDIAERALRTDSEDLTEFAEQIADQVQSFLISVRDIAAQPDEDGVDEGLASLPYLLLEVSQLLLARVALEPLLRDEVLERTQPPAGQQQLTHLEQQVRQ